MTQLNYAFTLFASLFVTALPFLVLGILVSSWLLVFVDEHQLAVKFPRNRFLGAIVGSSLGFLVPVCLYGNIPVARRLLLQGVPVSVGLSFLVAAPTINPITIWMTWQAFPNSHRIVLLRVLLAWMTGIAIGCLFSTYRDQPPAGEETSTLTRRSTLLRSGTFLRPSEESQPLHRVGNLVYGYQTAAISKQPLTVALRLFLENIGKELLELGGALALGSAIAAAIQIFLPQAALLAWSQTPVQGILVLMLLALVLSIGSVPNSFFASGLAVNFLNGSLLAFLQLGSMVDIKQISLLLAIFRSKIVIYLLILALQFPFLFALLLDFYVN